MAGATILFVDMVGFSLQSAVTEKLLVEKLNQALRPYVRHLFNLKPEQLLCLPTGDGVALTFLHVDGRRMWSIEAIVDLIFDLQAWASKLSARGESLPLRIGVHVGAVHLLKDINGRPNVCGSTINVAQRVMDAAHPRQVLFSEEAVREYVGKASDVWKLTARRHRLYRIAGPFEVHAKHGEPFRVFQLQPEGVKNHGWCNDPPEIKFWLSVKPAAPAKPILDAFAEQLSKAKDVALVQRTGDRLLRELVRGTVRLSGDLRKLWVFMPEERYFLTSAGRKDTSAVNKLRVTTEGWRKYLAKERKTKPNSEICLLRYKTPPYFGASYLDWEEPGGQIHVSPYISGVEPSQCPGFNISWVGSRPLPIYRSYAGGLRDLYQHSTRLE